MNGFTLLIGSAVIFLIAYVVYGSWLAKQWGIDPKRKTPAETQKDGIDYLPTKPAVLLGHHFSSIAGAGPIVGPITAAVFGWVPVTLWIIVGSVFFGGVHDYGSLVASLRHKGKSIGQIIEANIGERAKILFAIFAWITLLVVIAPSPTSLSLLSWPTLAPAHPPYSSFCLLSLSACSSTVPAYLFSSVQSWASSACLPLSTSVISSRSSFLKTCGS